MNAYSVPLETELLNRETPAEVKKMQKRLIFLEGLVKELCWYQVEECHILHFSAGSWEKHINH